MADAQPGPGGTGPVGGGSTPPVTLVAPDDVGRILVVCAHPDDCDFGAAGSIAAWVKAGAFVAYCIVTDGDAGGSEPHVSRRDVARTRREEQLAAAGELGVDDVTFLGYPDGRLVPSIELRRDITRQIRRVRPDRLVCQSPERNWDRIVASHPDHLAAGEASICAVYPDARNPFAHPELLDEGFEPFAVPEVWLMAAPKANRGIEVTNTFDQKLRALRCHVSQVGDGEFLDGLIRGWLGPQALAAGLDEGRYVEVFRAVTTA